MLRILTLLIFICMFNKAAAQDTYLNSGSITFEKKVNMYALIRKYNNLEDGMMKEAFAQYQRSHSQFRLQRSTLKFSANKTLFVPAPDSGASDFMSRHPLVHQNNTIYTDLDKHSYVCQKNVYDKIYLVSDTTRRIQWKITSEKREIAGYQCRRANALIMDSVYVVAFYTDEIQISGGPESFTGLPGMILGLAFPHDNVSWFATSVDLAAIPAVTITPPVKGKAIDIAGLQQYIISDGTKNKATLRWFFL